MHDSNGAEDAGISFSFKGGGGFLGFMLIMFSLHSSCCRQARRCYQTKTYRQLNTEYIMIVHTCGADCVNYSSDILLGINEFKWGVIHLDR